MANVGKTLAEARYREMFDKFVNQFCKDKEIERDVLTDDVMSGLEKMAEEHGIIKPSTPLGLRANALMLQVEGRARGIERKAQQQMAKLMEIENGDDKLLEDAKKGLAKPSPDAKPDAPSSGGYCTVS